MNSAHHSVLTLPSPRFVLPAATPEGTLTRLTLHRVSRPRPSTPSFGDGTVAPMIRCGTACSSRYRAMSVQSAFRRTALFMHGMVVRFSAELNVGSVARGQPFGEARVPNGPIGRLMRCDGARRGNALAAAAFAAGIPQRSRGAAGCDMALVTGPIDARDRSRDLRTAALSFGCVGANSWSASAVLRA